MTVDARRLSILGHRRGLPRRQAQSCGGAYIGAGAHGRNGFYRYYLCRTRQAKGARACTAPRVPEVVAALSELLAEGGVRLGL